MSKPIYTELKPGFLEPGDIFVVKVDSWFGKAINFFQKIWAKDNESTYSHAGIILDPDGTTFEALETIKRQNLFTDYAGKRVRIGRYVKMNQTKFFKGWAMIQHYEGKAYPVWRLVFHIIPPVAKFVRSIFGVCSEVVGRFLCGVGIVNVWSGLNPDDIADMIKRWDDFDVVYEGTVPEVTQE
jgi:hypothetical protein